MDKISKLQRTRETLGTQYARLYRNYSINSRILKDEMTMMSDLAKRLKELDHEIEMLHQQNQILDTP